MYVINDLYNIDSLRDVFSQEFSASLWANQKRDNQIISRIYLYLYHTDNINDPNPTHIKNHIYIYIYMYIYHIIYHKYNSIKKKYYIYNILER